MENVIDLTCGCLNVVNLISEKKKENYERQFF